MIFYEGHKVYMNGEYPATWIDRRNQHIHILEWVKHNGEIPKGMIVHHKDENKMNWNISNLELLTRAEHIRKHKEIVHRKGVLVRAKKDNIVKLFDSIQDAAIFCNTYPCSIQRCFKGKQNKANGWEFERVG